MFACHSAVHRARSPHARSPATRERCWLTRCCMTRMCFSPSSMERSPCVYDDLIPHLCPWRLSLRRTLQRQSTSAPRRLINAVNIRRLLHVRRLRSTSHPRGPPRTTLLGEFDLDCCSSFGGVRRSHEPDESRYRVCGLRPSCVTPMQPHRRHSATPSSFHRGTNFMGS